MLWLASLHNSSAYKTLKKASLYGDLAMSRKGSETQIPHNQYIWLQEMRNAQPPLYFHHDRLPGQMQLGGCSRFPIREDLVSSSHNRGNRDILQGSTPRCTEVQIKRFCNLRISLMLSLLTNHQRVTIYLQWRITCLCRGYC